MIKYIYKIKKEREIAMNINKEKIDKILEAIFPLPEEFGLYYDNADSPYLRTLEETIYEVDKKATIMYGMSKFVIMSPYFGDVVIKIPFNGYFNYENNWCFFEGGSGPDFTDYCYAEYEKFKELQKHKLNCFVAKTLLYKTIGNFNIFLQERVTPEKDSWKPPIASDNSKKIAEEWYDEGRFIFIESDWIANCIDKYGEAKVKQFLDYCNEMDRDILADAHSGNYGYRINKTPCILDYSDFLD